MGYLWVGQRLSVERTSTGECGIIAPTLENYHFLGDTMREFPESSIVAIGSLSETFTFYKPRHIKTKQRSILLNPVVLTHGTKI